MTRCKTVLGFVAIVAGCVDEHRAVVRTAEIAEDPWTCAVEQTKLMKVSYGVYRLTGCGRTAVYSCNFAFKPPRCWRRPDG